MKNFRQIVEANLGTSVGDFLQSRIHEGFTIAADKLAQLGIVDVEERIAISSCIGTVLEKFREELKEKVPSAVDSPIPVDILMQLTFRD